MSLATTYTTRDHNKAVLIGRILHDHGFVVEIETLERFIATPYGDMVSRKPLHGRNAVTTIRTDATQEHLADARKAYHEAVAQATDALLSELPVNTGGLE